MLTYKTVQSEDKDKCECFSIGDWTTTQIGLKYGVGWGAKGNRAILRVSDNHLHYLPLTSITSRARTPNQHQPTPLPEGPIEQLDTQH